jgi:hypothetical protein
MTDHVSYARFTRCRSPLAFESVPAGHHAPSARRRAPRIRDCATRFIGVGLDPIPHTCLDDFLGGRSDRIGRDLLFDLRSAAEIALRPLRYALPLSTPYAAPDVLLHIRSVGADLVWLYVGDTNRAQVMGRHIVDAGVEALIVDGSDDDW